MSVRRLWLVDHLLQDQVGHHLGYNLAIADAAQAADAEAVVVGHARFHPSLFQGHAAVANFRTDWRAVPPAWASRNQRLLRLLEIWSGARFNSDLQRWGNKVGFGDLIFAQMIAPRHFLAWLEWFGSRGDPPRLVLHLGYQPHRFDTDVLRNALRRLPSTHRTRVFFVTDSEKLQGPFARALATQIFYLPHIVDDVFPDTLVERSPRPIRVLAPGNARREKGFAETLESVELLAELRKSWQLEFRVQCHQPDHFCSAIVAGVHSARGLELVAEPLGKKDYCRQFAEADLILIPYHLDHYAMRTSGVFCEARVCGKPVIASRGSWAGDRVARQGGGWLCNEKNGADLANTIRSAAAELGPQARRATELQGESRREFSASSFVRGLFELSGWGVQS
jgi:glycosyltransferase involved in cell wall biosynthesis